LTGPLSARYAAIRGGGGNGWRLPVSSWEWGGSVEIRARSTTPLYRQLEAVQLAISAYTQDREAETPHAPKLVQRTSGPKDGTTTAAVLDAAEEFLAQLGRRAQTPEIAGELGRRGVIPSLEMNIVRSVASYLSTAKSRFDNVRGQGYGLVRWSTQDPPEAPDGSVSALLGLNQRAETEVDGWPLWASPAPHTARNENRAMRRQSHSPASDSQLPALNLGPQTRTGYRTFGAGFQGWSSMKGRPPCVDVVTHATYVKPVMCCGLCVLRARLSHTPRSQSGLMWAPSAILFMAAGSPEPFRFLQADLTARWRQRAGHP